MANDVKLRMAVEGKGVVSQEVDQITQSLDKATTAADKVGMSTKAYNAALRGVPAQFTDIFTSLQGGQAPMTVLLQQGGQLKDMFGGVSGAVRALGGYMVGLVNPFTVGAAAAGMLAVAYHQATSEVDANRKAIVLSGNASGTTIGQMQSMAREISATAKAMVGASSDALNQMVSGGNVATASLVKVTDAAIRLERLGGVAIKETVSAYAELANDPVAASEKLNRQYNYLTAAVYEQIKALNDQGDKAAAVSLAQNEMASAQARMADEMELGLGRVEQAWNKAGKAAKGAWDEFVGLFRPDPIDNVIAELEAKMKFSTGFYGVGGNDKTAIQAQLDYWKHIKASQEDFAANQAKIKTQTEAQIALDKAYDANLSKTAKMQKEIAAAAANFAKADQTVPGNVAKYAKTIADIQDKYKEAKTPKALITEADKALAFYNDLMDESSGYTRTYAEEQNKLALALKTGQIGYEQYATAAQALLKKQPMMVKSNEAEKKAIDDLAKARDAELKAHANELSGLTEKAQKLEDEVAYYGMAKTALEELTTARMLDQIEVLKGFDNSDEEIARIKQVIAARQRLATAATALDIKDAEKKAAEEAVKEWEKYADQIGQSLTDQLMEGGKSGAEYIESLFRTMVLRPVIQALVTPVAQSVSTSIMGSLSGGTSGGSSGGNASGFNLFNSYSGIGDGLSVTLGKAASSLINNGFDTAGTALADLAKTANTYSSQITAFGNGLSYLNAAQSLADGKYGAAAGQALGTYFGGPIGGTIGNAIGSAIDKAFGGGGGPKSESSYGNLASLGNTSATGLAGTYATGVEDAWATLAKQLDLSTQLKVGTFVGIDSAGDAMTQLATSGTVNGQQIYSRAARGGGYENVGRSEEALQAALTEETTRILFAALKASDLPDQYKTYLNTIGNSVADMTVAMSNVSLIKSFTTALEALPFANLRDLSFDAAKGLIDVAGGLDVLQTNLGTYYTNFYTAEEQRLQTIANINTSTVGSGLDAATATRDSFRALVEAQDLTTTSGQATYAALLSVAGAFASITDSSDTLATAAAALKTAWTSVTDTLVEEVTRIKGLMSTGTSSTASYANAQMQFALTTAQARAGDQDAASLLPELSQTMLTLAAAQATTLTELRAIQAQTASSLTTTTNLLADQYGITLPSFAVGTNLVPRDMVAQIHAGEAIVPAAYNPANGGAVPAQNNAELVAEIRALREEVVNLRAEARSSAISNSKTAKILERVTPDGSSLQTVSA